MAMSVSLGDFCTPGGQTSLLEVTGLSIISTEMMEHDLDQARLPGHCLGPSFWPWRQAGGILSPAISQDQL